MEHSFWRKKWNMIWNKLIRHEYTQEKIIHTYVCALLHYDSPFLWNLHIWYLYPSHAVLSHIRQLIFMGHAFWSDSMLKEFSIQKIMEQNNKEEIYVAVMSLKARIWCVHTNDIYIAYFLRKKNLPCVLNFKHRKLGRHLLYIFHSFLHPKL